MLWKKRNQQQSNYLFLWPAMVTSRAVRGLAPYGKTLIKLATLAQGLVEKNNKRHSEE